MRDFTLGIYRELLLDLQQRGYALGSFAEYQQGTLPSKHVILRHDVDRLPSRSLEMAKVEKEIGARATYYFRIKPISFVPKIMRDIGELGHEIGYHYEELADTAGNKAKAWQLFKENVEQFRTVSPVRSIAMHGRPFSPWDNRDVWNEYDYNEIGITLEAYRDVEWGSYAYFTDVGRSWSSSLNQKDYATGAIVLPGARNVRTTQELIPFLRNHDCNFIISTHPERWSDSLIGWSQVLLTDGAINVAKRCLRGKPSDRESGQALC